MPASTAFVTDSNRPQPLWQPPPTACPNASGAASEVLVRAPHTHTHRPVQVIVDPLLLKHRKNCHGVYTKCRASRCRAEAANTSRRGHKGGGGAGQRAFHDGTSPVDVDMLDGRRRQRCATGGMSGVLPAARAALCSGRLLLLSSSPSWPLCVPPPPSAVPPSCTAAREMDHADSSRNV